jgi:hypothetical protein
MALARRGKPRLYGKEDTLQRLGIATICQSQNDDFAALARKINILSDGNHP